MFFTLQDKHFQTNEKDSTRIVESIILYYDPLTGAAFL